jgi:hypothetical protein
VVGGLHTRTHAHTHTRTHAHTHTHTFNNTQSSSTVAPPSQTSINASASLAPPVAIASLSPVTSPLTGDVLSIDSQSLRLNGVPILPSGGEMHCDPFRVPRNSWRSDLLKMKAGGLDVVSA